MRYHVSTVDGKKRSFHVRNDITKTVICNCFGDFMAANHIVMCLNMYADLKAIDKLSEVLKMLDDYGK